MPSEDKDGPMDRLAKALFASPDSPFTAFADKQRSERLEQCKDHEDILMACQRANEIGNNDSAAAVDNNDVSVGSKSRSEARIKRFFKWNDPQPSSNDESSVLQDASASILGGNGDSDGSDKQRSNNQRMNKNSSLYSKGCIRETHEMWACRALALGCGNHLSDLRRCWSDAASVQNKGELTFKDGDSGSDTSCRGIQQQMARCVVKNTAELKERMAAAAKK